MRFPEAASLRRRRPIVRTRTMFGQQQRAREAQRARTFDRAAGSLYYTVTVLRQGPSHVRRANGPVRAIVLVGDVLWRRRVMATVISGRRVRFRRRVIRAGARVAGSVH